MTQVEFLQTFKLLELNYDKEVHDPIVMLWYDEFKNESVEVFKKAIVECIEYERLFPTMDIVRRYVIKNSRRQF